MRQDTLYMQVISKQMGGIESDNYKAEQQQ